LSFEAACDDCSAAQLRWRSGAAANGCNNTADNARPSKPYVPLPADGFVLQ